MIGTNAALTEAILLIFLTVAFSTAGRQPRTWSDICMYFYTHEQTGSNKTSALHTTYNQADICRRILPACLMCVFKSADAMRATIPCCP